MKENYVFWYIVLKNRRCFRKQQKSLGDLELSFVHAWTVIKKQMEEKVECSHRHLVGEKKLLLLFAIL